MGELDHKAGWALKNWCFWIVVLEKTFESPLDCKEIKLVNLQINQSWIFIGRTDAEAEAPILRPLDVKKPSLEKTLIMRKIKGKRKRVRQRVRWLDSITDSINMNQSKLWEIIKDREAFTGMLPSMCRKSVTRFFPPKHKFKFLLRGEIYSKIWYVSPGLFWCYRIFKRIILVT